MAFCERNGALCCRSYKTEKYENLRRSRPRKAYILTLNYSCHCWSTTAGTRLFSRETNNRLPRPRIQIEFVSLNSVCDEFRRFGYSCFRGTPKVNNDRDVSVSMYFVCRWSKEKRLVGERYFSTPRRMRPHAWSPTNSRFFISIKIISSTSFLHFFCGSKCQNTAGTRVMKFRSSESINHIQSYRIPPTTFTFSPLPCPV